MLTKYEQIIDGYKTWYPNLHSRTVECRPSGYYTILVTLDDGSKMEYSSFDNTIRDVTKLYIRDESGAVDETVWRKEFGHRLRTTMTEKCMNQERLADLIGVSRQMMSRYVRGTSTPSGYTLTRLSEVLGCDVRELTRFGYIEN